MLADMVKAGKLPPVEQRIPAEPLVWQPLNESGKSFGSFGAALLFGFSTALAFRLPNAYPWADSYATLFQTLPYVLTLIAIAGVIGRTVPPAADGRPYKKQ